MIFRPKTPRDLEIVNKSPLQAAIDFLFGYDFFICYAWSDARNYATGLAEILRKQGFECFLDSKEFAKGDNWPIVGRRALHKTAKLLLLGSPGALHSDPVLREIQAFQSKNRTILPIDFGNTLRNPDRTNKLLQQLSPNILSIRAELNELSIGPSDNTINEIRTSFDLLRQQQKRIRWLASAAVLFGIMAVLATVGGVLAWAEDIATQKLLYVSEINSVQQALETHNVQRARDLLDEQARNPSVKARDRFEWNLFWHFCHRELITFEPQLAWKELHETEPQAIWIKAIAVSGDGKTLAAAAWDRKVTFWDLDQKKQIGSLFAHDREVSAMTLSEDGNKLATGNNRGEIKFWRRNADSWESVNLPNQAGAINCLRFSPRSPLFASACSDHFTKLWDANGHEPREVKSFRSSTNVNAVAFSGDGGKLAFAGEDRLIHLCDMASLEELPTQLPCRSSVNSLSFSRDGAIIVAGCEDGTITLWNLKTNHSSTHSGHLAAVLSVTLSNDGKLLVTGSEDYSIKLWPINNTDELDDLGGVTLRGHTDYVNQVALTPKGEMIISGSNDGLRIRRR